VAQGLTLISPATDTPAKAANHHAEELVGHLTTQGSSEHEGKHWSTQVGIHKNVTAAPVEERASHWFARQNAIMRSIWAIKDDMFLSSQKRHPCWLFEWNVLSEGMVYLCGFVLFLAGILCSAGGIGGGGVYVTVLMVAGKLEIGDAVPLSHSIVFLGSLTTLVMNMRKANSSNGVNLIDYSICRLVVPFALAGTYCGVVLNSLLPGWIISLCLTLILVFITVMVGRTTWTQYREETTPKSTVMEASAVSASNGDGNGGASNSALASPPSGSPASVPPPTKIRKLSVVEQLDKFKLQYSMTRTDLGLFFMVLFVVITCGVFRYHAGACQHALPHLAPEICNHKILGYLGKGTLQKWVMNSSLALFIGIFSFLFPLAIAASVGAVNTVRLCKDGWSVPETLKYSFMAFITGALSGLVGIGGGLIFSPFFLVSGVEPAVAVATSSTCVIFTAASTTMQYVLTDRVIMSLTILFGVVNLVASAAGTKLVHVLQEKFDSRKSFISGIVLVGVLVSFVLGVYKFIDKVVDTFYSPANNVDPIYRSSWE
jgi:uncharacterized membrane protein YfcA